MQEKEYIVYQCVPGWNYPAGLEQDALEVWISVLA